MKEMEFKYLKNLAELYPTVASASTEIINLQAILNLPKATEHFLTDIHGEYEAFSHVLKNGSGSVRRKIDDELGNNLCAKDKRALATLIYYPKEKLKLIRQEEENIEDWYRITLYRLIQVAKRVASKYTRSKVRKALPKDFAYIIEELITEKAEVYNKEGYYNEIVNTIIRIGRAGEFIVALSELIQRLVVDHLHILGDIYDRGPGPHLIMDRLMEYHSIDIQWGNHDVVWMGAAAGNLACIANIVRICARYANLDILEDGYGINLLPLATFAMDKYGDDECACFKIKGREDASHTELSMEEKMHKAMSIIQFKVEGQLIKRRPEFQMKDRLLLDKIDYEKGTVTIDGKQYPMKDMNFPTIDPKAPYKLSEEEEVIMNRLQTAFENCEKLQKHIRFLYTKGSLYKVFNSNLLYHGCVPLNEDGSFREVKLFGKKYTGKALFDILEIYARKGYYAIDPVEKEQGKDILWYIWMNENSPLFGKDKMATFERYFLEDKTTHLETKNPYYQYIESEDTVNQILEEFGLDPAESHIVNGHMPVQLKKGESPVKCGGKVLVIDGGFSKAYQKQTGIAGYTLIYNSYGLRLVAHEPFESAEAAIANETDIHSDTIVVERVVERKMVGDTDTGVELRERVEELEALLKAYREGEISEKSVF